MPAQPDQDADWPLECGANRPQAGLDKWLPVSLSLGRAGTVVPDLPDRRTDSMNQSPVFGFLLAAAAVLFLLVAGAEAPPSWVTRWAFVIRCSFSGGPGDVLPSTLGRSRSVTRLHDCIRPKANRSSR